MLTNLRNAGRLPWTFLNEEKQMAIFSVTDTGCGIPKEKQGLCVPRVLKSCE